MDFKLSAFGNGKLTRLCRAESGGLSLTFLFFTIFILSLLGVISYSVMIVESRSSLSFMQNVQAQYIAEAGVEYGLKRAFSGETPPYSESVSLNAGSFQIDLATQGTLLKLTSTGTTANAERVVEVVLDYQPPIGDFAIYSTGGVDNVASLDENGDPDPTLLVEHAPSLPTIDNDSLLTLATDQGHIETASEFDPNHGYPNFNFYYSGSTPNVTHVQGDLRVLGGRTVYGVFVVEGDIILDGSSRVVGVLYLRNPQNIVIHGGGSPTESSVTGGIISAGDVDGTGNHITVRYNSEYMGIFGGFEGEASVSGIISWREL